MPVINVAIGNYRDTNLPIKTYGLHHHLRRLNTYNAVLECDNYDALKLMIKKIINGSDETKLNRRTLFQEELSNFKGEASNKIIDEIIKFEKI